MCVTDVSWSGHVLVWSLRGVATLTSCFCSKYLQANGLLLQESGKLVSLEDAAKISMRNRELQHTVETPHDRSSATGIIPHENTLKTDNKNYLLPHETLLQLL